MDPDYAHIRSYIEERLSLLHDSEAPPLHSPGHGHETADEENWQYALSMIGDLYEENQPFFKDHGYLWALERDSYHHSLEAHSQRKMIQALIRCDPQSVPKEALTNIVIRYVVNSSARPQLREVGPYKVVVLTTGFSSLYRSFCRFWMKACELGGVSRDDVPTKLFEQTRAFLHAVTSNGKEVCDEANSIIRALYSRSNNQIPYEDYSVRGEVLAPTLPGWETFFSLVLDAVDSFVLFHEMGHILANHGVGPRDTQQEHEADTISLIFTNLESVIEGVPYGVMLGPPTYFCMEVLKWTFDFTWDYGAAGRKDEPESDPVLFELMARNARLEDSILRMGLVSPRDSMEWRTVVSLVHATIMSASRIYGTIQEQQVADEKVNWERELFYGLMDQLDIHGF